MSNGISPKKAELRMFRLPKNGESKLSNIKSEAQLNGKSKLSPPKESRRTINHHPNVPQEFKVKKSKKSDDPFLDLDPPTQTSKISSPFMKSLKTAQLISGYTPTNNTPGPKPRIEVKSHRPENQPPQQKLPSKINSPPQQQQRTAAKYKVRQSSDDNDIPLEILEEMDKVQETFKDLNKKYRLIDKIGEGTFSTVYKAEDITGKTRYLMGDSIWSSPDIKKRKIQKKASKTYVALKRIYVTSSPQRIFNELNLLYMLSGSPRVAPLLEALRFQDQIIAVLPYYGHADFREFFRDLPLEGIKIYMFELFEALNFIHSKKIIHRDIKPTNFLYDPFKKRGVLVDFGLAEQEFPPATYNAQSMNYCPCAIHERYAIHDEVVKGYPKDDPRPGRRANRAGTRGFRAPEVLFKCPNQTRKIDIWSAGVILLTLLTRRFPFFNSPDDVDALVELTTIFGSKEMQECANLHGLGLDVTITTLGSTFTIEELVHWCLNLEHEAGMLPADCVGYDTLSAFNSDGHIIYTEEDDDSSIALKRQHQDAIQVIKQCFILDPSKRSSAAEILRLPFFKTLFTEEEDDVLIIE